MARLAAHWRAELEADLLRVVLVLHVVESSSTLGSEYYKTGALQQWTLVQPETE